MRVEDLSVVIRPRRPWEAVDLGAAMVRRWAGPLYLLWCATVFPAYALASVVFWNEPWLAGLLIWWLKPAFDRMQLLVLSRAVFGAVPGWRETLAALPGLLRGSGLFWHLTLWRIDPSRSFRLPVLQLEGLRGAERRTRIRLLGKRITYYRVGLTGIGMVFEGVIWLSAFGLIWMLTPLEHDAHWLSLDDDAVWRWHAPWLYYVLAMTAIEPFYVAAGFALYLNRRTLLEGWDIELGLRRLGRRLAAKRAPAAALAVLAAALWLAGPLEAARAAIGDEPLAETLAEPAAAREVIEAIMTRETFDTTVTRTRWLRSDERDEERAEFPGWLDDLTALLGGLAEVLLWSLLIVLGVWAAWWARQFVPVRAGDPRTGAAPDTVAGFDIRPDSLPDDVADAARTAWRNGRHRDAASLLYRATLSRLTDLHTLLLEKGHTEGDVLSLARTHLQAEDHRALAGITGIWQRIAYAHRIPDAAAFERCLADYQERFA